MNALIIFPMLLGLIASGARAQVATPSAKPIATVDAAEEFAPSCAVVKQRLLQMLIRHSELRAFADRVREQRKLSDADSAELHAITERINLGRPERVQKLVTVRATWPLRDFTEADRQALIPRFSSARKDFLVYGWQWRGTVGALPDGFRASLDQRASYVKFEFDLTYEQFCLGKPGLQFELTTPNGQVKRFTASWNIDQWVATRPPRMRSL